MRGIRLGEAELWLHLGAKAMQIAASRQANDQLIWGNVACAHITSAISMGMISRDPSSPSHEIPARSVRGASEVSRLSRAQPDLVRLICWQSACFCSPE